MRYFTPRYEEQDDPELRKQRAKMHAIFNNLPEWRKELAHHKMGATSKVTRDKKRGIDIASMRSAREEAEANGLATLRKCVEAMEMAVEAVNSVPAPSQYQSQFNTRAVRDIIFTMRNKMRI